MPTPRELWDEGYAAKMKRMARAEGCPIAAELKADRRAAEHDLIRCPWCRGWASAELRLYQERISARGGS